MGDQILTSTISEIFLNLVPSRTPLEPSIVSLVSIITIAGVFPHMNFSNTSEQHHGTSLMRLMRSRRQAERQMGAMLRSNSQSSSRAESAARAAQLDESLTSKELC